MSRRNAIRGILIPVSVILIGFLIVRLETDRARRMLEDVAHSVWTHSDTDVVTGVEFKQTTIDKSLAQQIAGHEAIDRLQFRECRFESGTFPLLCELSRIKYFNLTDCTWESDEELTRFLATTHFDLAEFRRTPLSDQHLQALGARSLWSLCIADCPRVTAAGMSALARRTTGQVAFVCSGISLTQADCRALRDSNPQLTIRLQPDDIVELRPLLAAGMQPTLNESAEVIEIEAEGVVPDPTLLQIEPVATTRRLVVANAELDDAHMRSIGSLSQLEFLSLEGSTIASGAFAHLARLTRLVDLNLDGVVLDGDEALELPSLPSIRSLRLCSGNVTDETLLRLQVPTLTFISVGPFVTNAGLDRLIDLPALNGIALYAMEVNPEVSTSLAAMPSLDYLGLIACDTDDTSLIEATRGDQLKTLHLIHTEVSPESVNRIRESAPGLFIIEWPSEAGSAAGEQASS